MNVEGSGEILNRQIKKMTMLNVKRDVVGDCREKRRVHYPLCSSALALVLWLTSLIAFQELLS